MTTGLVHLGAAEIASLTDGPAAVTVLAESLRSGRVDPEADGPRLFAPVRDGAEFLVMPTAAATSSGVKVLTLTPGNPAQGHPTVQGVYVLFQGESNTPVAVLDAAELTLLRTPATTVLAARHLLAVQQGVVDGTPLDDDVRIEAGRVVVLGTGPQAARHIAVLHAVLAPADVAVVGRRPEAVAAVVDGARRAGIPARAATAADLPAADLVVCTTSSATPLFDDGSIAGSAVVCGVGVHGPGKAELPAALVARADLVVEARVAALRESGNLLQTYPASRWTEVIDSGGLANLQDLVRGRFPHRPGHPAVFSGVGMAWQDLVVAEHVVRRHTEAQDGERE